MLRDLPNEMLDAIGKEVDSNTLGSLTLVNKQFYFLFSNDLPERRRKELINILKDEYQFPPQQILADLNRFDQLFGGKHYGALLNHLQQLSAKWQTVKPNTQDMNLYNLLLFCSDVPNDIINHLPSFMQEPWLPVAINAGCVEIPKSLLTEDNQCSMLRMACLGGNLLLVKQLLDPKNQFNIPVYEDSLNQAIASRNLKLIQYLIDTQHLKPGMDELHTALQQKNAPLLQYLLDPAQHFDLHPQGQFKADIDAVLNASANETHAEPQMKLSN